VIPHLHGNAAQLAFIIAVLIVVRFLVKTWGGRHADNPAIQGLVYVLD
jgi:hypothetical protein